VSATGTEHPGLNDAKRNRLDDHLLGALDMRDVDVRYGGDLAMDLEVTPRLTNNRGGLQGGLLVTLIDVVAGRAALEGMPRGISVATADLAVHFLSAVTVGPAHAEATVLRRGKTKIVLRVDVFDAGRDDKLAAVCTTSFAVVPLRADQHDFRPVADGKLRAEPR
jgi:uncharacterized protein (TIGR00369 family)